MLRADSHLTKYCIVKAEFSCSCPRCRNQKPGTGNGHSNHGLDSAASRSSCTDSFMNEIAFRGFLYRSAEAAKRTKILHSSFISSYSVLIIDVGVGS
jgi:hypothetical protein